MKRKRFSVPRIRDPRYPHIQVRVVALAGSPFLFLGRQKDCKPTYAVICVNGRKFTPASLGDTKKERADRARALGLDAIKKIAEQEMAPKPEPTDDRLTLSQLIETYERDGFAGRTDAYRRDSLAALRRLAAFLEEDAALCALKPSDMEKYYAKRAAAKHAPAGRGDLVALKIACRWAWRNGLLDQSPFATAQFDKIIPPKGTQRRPVAKKDRYDAIKAVATQLPPAFEVLLDLAWETGKSHGGIRTLRWEHVALTPAKQAPHGSVTWYADRAKETVDTKKRRIHTRPLNANASAALQRWRKMTKGIGGAFVFPSPSDPNKPLDYATTKKWMRKAENLAKVPHFKQGVWHPYRRGWAVARKHEFSPAELAAANDWRDPSMVVLYQAADEESTLEAATFVA